MSYNIYLSICQRMREREKKKGLLQNVSSMCSRTKFCWTIRTLVLLVIHWNIFQTSYKITELWLACYKSPPHSQVFGNSNSADMTEKFRDVHQFCDHVSRLMVTKVCQRASNQSTEIASCAIAKFLEIENSEESSSGWMLLSTLNLLAAGDVSLVEVIG